MKIKLDDVMQSMSYPFDAAYYYYIPLETVLMFHNGRIYGKAVFGISDESDVEKNKDEFIRLPDLGKKGHATIMKGFAKQVKDEETREYLLRTIENTEDGRYFDDAVSELKLQMEWYTYRDRVHKEFALRWCRSVGLEAVE